LLDSAELRRTMGLKAAAHAREHFDEQRVTMRLVDIYRRALVEAGVEGVRMVPGAPLAAAGANGRRPRDRRRPRGVASPSLPRATGRESA
jgi:hypothetical protein